MFKNKYLNHSIILTFPQKIDLKYISQLALA